jgi:hypothetical protein
LHKHICHTCGAVQNIVWGFRVCEVIFGSSPLEGIEFVKQWVDKSTKQDDIQIKLVVLEVIHVDLVDVRKQHEHVQEMEATSDQVETSSELLPFELDDFFKRGCLKNVDFVCVLATMFQ